MLLFIGQIVLYPVTLVFGDRLLEIKSICSIIFLHVSIDLAVSLFMIYKIFAFKKVVLPRAADDEAEREGNK